MKPFVLALIAALTTASLAAQEPYGTGLAGTGGIVPRLRATQAWMGNANFGWTLSDCVGGSFAYLALSLAPDNQSLGGIPVLVSGQPGIFLTVEVLTLSGLPGDPGAGTASFSAPLNFPPIPSLAGESIYAQAFVLDGAGIGSLSATNGMRSEFTYPPSIFAGSSTAGTTDPFWFVDPQTGTVSEQGGNASSNNVTEVVFARGGSRIFTSSSGNLGVMQADLSTSPSSWSTFYTAGNPCYGIGYDRDRKIVYTLHGVTAQTRDLYAIDADPASPTYGTAVAQTTNFSNGIGAERWGLSTSGKFAAIPLIYLSGGPLRVIDTDPSSPSYMTTIFSAPTPNASGLVIAVGAVFTPDDSDVFFAFGGLVPSQIARFSLLTGQFVDMDPSTPAIDNIVLPQTVANRMAMSRDGRYLVVTGSGSGGWVAKVELDPSNPSNYTLSYLNPGPGLTVSATAPSISPDGTQICWLSNLSSPTQGRMIITDEFGTLQSTVFLTGSSFAPGTTEWR